MDGDDLRVVRPDVTSAIAISTNDNNFPECEARGPRPCGRRAMMRNELTLSHFSARVRGAMRSMILLTHLAIDMAGQDRALTMRCVLLSELAPEFVLMGGRQLSV